MNTSTVIGSVGRKVVAALLMIVLLSVFMPTRGAEVWLSSYQLRAHQGNGDTVGTVEHPFVLEINRAATYLTHSEGEIRLPSPVSPIHLYRGPPVLS